VIHIKMQGSFDDVVIDATEKEFLVEANAAAQQGLAFVMMRNSRGRLQGIHVKNILTFEGTDDDDTSLLG
jgi:hypothetical protein